MGKVYVQVVVDVFCSIAFAKPYNSKMPITACDLLYDRVLPFYETLGVPVGAILTDNGREFCGRPEIHPYELLAAVEGIERRTTKVRSPRNVPDYCCVWDFLWARTNKLSKFQYPLLTTARVRAAANHMFLTPIRNLLFLPDKLWIGCK